MRRLAELFRDDRFWRWFLWIGVGIFLATRLITPAPFPVFNDEAIYLQYSQLIHEDFGRFKFVSQGAFFADWKPPLQYWFGALFIGLGDDPILAGRLASFFMSLFGLGGFYLFTRELFGKKEAALAVFLYALFPPALFHNNQFIAETYVFSLAPWMYWAFLRSIRADKIRLQYALLAAVFGAMTVLAKQSGTIYLGLSMLLPLCLLFSRGSGVPAGGAAAAGMKRRDWKGIFLRLAVLAGGIVLALILRRIGVAPGSGEIQARFQSAWLMGLPQILEFPWATWLSNLRLVGDYYLHYYSVFILLPLLYFFSAAVRRPASRNVFLGLGFLGGSTAIIFLLKGFNEYIYNTAVVVFLIPILARTLLSAWSVASRSVGAVRAAALVLVSFALMLGHWTYQDAVMKISPGRYIERSTPWAVNNYLANWSGGFGVAEAVAYLRQQEGPALVLADPQWGNPRTALEVYAFKQPELRVIGLTREFATEEGTRAAKEVILGEPFRTRLAVFSAARNEVRAVWQDNLEEYLCDERREIQTHPLQPPIIICGF